MISFKSDLQAYRGQKNEDAFIGGQDMSMGESPSRKNFSFQNDLKSYQSETKSPSQLMVEQNRELINQKALKEQKEKIAEEQKRKEILDSLPDVTNENETHQKLAPDEIVPTPNIEIDYANADLKSKEITAVPEGTVGGHCGVYAQNVVKLPKGKNWVVGDSIEQKIKSVQAYREKGLAFLPEEDTPRVGNALIMDMGTKWGHVAVVNNIDENGVMTITESNWNWDKRVTHTRKMMYDDPRIVGYLRTQ